MNILVTLDSNYVYPLKVMLTSLFMNNKHEKFKIFVVHSNLKENELRDINKIIERNNSQMSAIKVDDEMFKEAPTIFHYTKAMYYRLLAYKILPIDVEKVLYLDPDILVLNEVKSLYDMDFQGKWFLAAYHDKIAVKSINKVRLYPFKIEKYYNSGVLLMNFNEIRKNMKEEDIFNFVKEYPNKLMMPDQDILNALYGSNIGSIDETLYNYDARFFSSYKAKSKKKYNMEYVINKTVFLHFCGKKKPWSYDYPSKFVSLYKAYEKIAKNNEIE